MAIPCYKKGSLFIDRDGMHYARLSLVMFEEGDLRSYGSFAVVSAELYAVNDNIHFNNKISFSFQLINTVSF